MEFKTAFEKNDSRLTITLSGKIDSSNAPAVESSILSELNEISHVDIDCKNLEYISSAGLRVLLKIKKRVPDVVLLNVSSEVYDILNLTGFTEMMDVRKAFRTIQVEGCEVVGTGANATVYRYDPETIVKVFRNPDSLDEIKKERELSRTAFVLGVPTAISYDIVQVESGLYGAVFELLNAESYQQLLCSGQKSVEEIAQMCVDMLKTVHTRLPKPGALPSKKDFEMKRLPRVKTLLPEDLWEKLNAMYEAIPENPHMVHGDFHIKNIMLQNDESLMIDMDTICTGDPIFEFSGMYVAYCAFSEFEKGNTEKFFGISDEDGARLFHEILNRYVEGTDIRPEDILAKAQVLSSTRILDYCVTGRHMPEARRALFQEPMIKKLEALIPTIDDLSSHIVY